MFQILIPQKVPINIAQSTQKESSLLCTICVSVFKCTVLAVDSEVGVVRGFYAADDLGIYAE